MIQHVAIIMDGNGRWAKRRGKPRVYGHIRGASRVREIVEECSRQGIRALTLYAFSTENWARPAGELEVLWKILAKFLKSEVDSLDRNGVRLHVIGEPMRLPRAAQALLEATRQRLARNTGLELTLALSYGAKAEIVHASRALATQVQAGALEPSQIDEAAIESQLATAFLRDASSVDLLIRTSGEQRLSNFLLWQCAYAEMVFTETAWPDFTVERFREALAEFGSRDRRYGALKKGELRVAQ